MISKRSLLIMSAILLAISLPMGCCIAPTPEQMAKRQAYLEYKEALSHYEPLLVQPAKIFKGWEGTTQNYDYQCPPEYHFVDCPKCEDGKTYETLYTVESRTVGVSKCGLSEIEWVEVPSSIIEHTCSRCEGRGTLCGPDGVEEPRRP